MPSQRIEVLKLKQQINKPRHNISTPKLNFLSPVEKDKKNLSIRNGKKIKVSGGCKHQGIANEILERNDFHIPQEYVSVGTSSFSFTPFFFLFSFLLSRDGSVLLKCGLVLFNGVIFLTPFLDSILEAKVSWWDRLPRKNETKKKKKKQDGYKRRKIFFRIFCQEKIFALYALHAYIFFSFKFDDIFFFLKFFYKPPTREFSCRFSIQVDISPPSLQNRQFFFHM